MGKKRGKAHLLAMLSILCLWLFGGICVSANDQKIVDLAGLLSESEEEALQEQFQDIADEYACDVAVVTVESCEGQDIESFTDDYFEKNGYGYEDSYDGILLLVSMEERQFHMTTMGTAIDIFTDYGMQVIDDRITDFLTDGEYYEAFQKFGALCKSYMEEARSAEPYDIDHTYSEPMALWLHVLLSAGAGLIAAGIVTGVLFAQLKSVGRAGQAQVYAREGSFRVTRANDLFLYRTVTSHKIERDQGNGGGGGGSTIHTTSGGNSAGGHTGSF